jgi:hypothetical protein
MDPFQCSKLLSLVVVEKVREKAKKESFRLLSLSNE